MEKDLDTFWDDLDPNYVKNNPALFNDAPPTTPKFELTSCQKRVSEKAMEWAHNDDQLFLAIAGPAGTGKSWLSRYLLSQFPQRKICVTAVTHQALKQIKAASGQEGKTGQSLLGLAPDEDLEDFDPVNVTFEKKNRPTIEDYELILWDEASMIGSALREYAQQLARHSKTKILFVGDAIQLPPVGERFPTAFDAQYIDGGVLRLSTPCRQSTENPLYTLLLAERNDIEQSEEARAILIGQLIEHGQYKGDLIDDLARTPHNAYKLVRNSLGDELINENGEGFKVYRNKRDFEVKMNNIFVDYFIAKDYSGVRTLAFTNDCVGLHNKSIRSTIFQGNHEAITVGDILMCYRPITYYDAAKKEKITLLYNSEEIIVLSADKRLSTLNIPIYGTHSKVIDEQRDFLLNLVIPGNYDSYIAQLNRTKETCKKNNSWGPFYGFYDQHALLESLKKLKNDKYLPDKAFDYAYAITVHKSQGSTFNEVFVDTVDIFKHYTYGKYFAEQDGTWCPELDTDLQRITRQLRYVAASRAKKFAYFFI